MCKEREVRDEGCLGGGWAGLESLKIRGLGAAPVPGFPPMRSSGWEKERAWFPLCAVIV